MNKKFYIQGYEPDKIFSNGDMWLQVSDDREDNIPYYIYLKNKWYYVNNTSRSKFVSMCKNIDMIRG